MLGTCPLSNHKGEAAKEGLLENHVSCTSLYHELFSLWRSLRLSLCMYWSCLLVASLQFVTGHVGVLEVAIGRRADSISLQPAVEASVKRAVPARPHTVSLPETFARRGTDAPDSAKRQYSLTYSHGIITDGDNFSLAAVGFGVYELVPALQAILDEANGYPVSETPQTFRNSSAQQLSVIIMPSQSTLAPLALSWKDYASVVQILLNDTQQHPEYETLFVGVVRDEDQQSYADVVVMPRMIMVDTPMLPINNLDSSTAPTSIPIRPPARRLGGSILSGDVWMLLAETRLVADAVPLDELRDSLQSNWAQGSDALTTVLLQHSSDTEVVEARLHQGPATELPGGGSVAFYLQILPYADGPSGMSALTGYELWNIHGRITSIIRELEPSTAIPGGLFQLNTDPNTDIALVRWGFRVNAPWLPAEAWHAGPTNTSRSTNGASNAVGSSSAGSGDTALQRWANAVLRDRPTTQPARFCDSSIRCIVAFLSYVYTCQATSSSGDTGL